MTQDIRRPARAGFGKGAALFPLALVAAAVAILAVGAGRTSEPADKAQARVAVASAEKAASREDIARENARAEEAAAAAMMALALARVAPTVDEARLAEAEQAAAQARKVEPEADKTRERRSVRREAAPGAKPAASTLPPVAEPAPVLTTTPEKVAEKPVEKPGMLRRMSEYVPSLPSPGRIVDAMGDGVSKIADLMPKF